MYDDPDATGHPDPLTRQKYVEAVTEADFEINVTLDQNFYWAGCDAVRVCINLDGIMDLFLDIKRQAHHSPYSQRRKAALGTMRRYCSETRQWQLGTLSFGELSISGLATQFNRHLGPG